MSIHIALPELDSGQGLSPDHVMFTYYDVNKAYTRRVVNLDAECEKQAAVVSITLTTLGHIAKCCQQHTDDRGLFPHLTVYEPRRNLFTVHRLRQRKYPHVRSYEISVSN